MFSFLKKAENNTSSFPWKNVDSTEILDSLMNSDTKVAIFKHSPRCIISKTVKKRFENEVDASKMDFYMISVIEERPLSNYVADQSGVIHQSPQLLIFEKGSCIYNESHDGIISSETVAFLHK
ncbi:MAG: bacillithiol system redox-active protein YtxJ [Flavobacteriales bacterium]